MVTLDLSKVDKKAQGPLELVSYWSLLVPLQATHTKAQLGRPKRLAQLGRPKRLAQLDNQLYI